MSISKGAWFVLALAVAGVVLVEAVGADDGVTESDGDDGSGDDSLDEDGTVGGDGIGVISGVAAQLGLTDLSDRTVTLGLAAAKEAEALGGDAVQTFNDFIAYTRNAGTN